MRAERLRVAGAVRGTLVVVRNPYVLHLQCPVGSRRGVQIVVAIAALDAARGRRRREARREPVAGAADGDRAIGVGLVRAAGKRARDIGIARTIFAVDSALEKV